MPLFTLTINKNVRSFALRSQRRQNSLNGCSLAGWRPAIISLMFAVRSQLQSIQFGTDLYNSVQVCTDLCRSVQICRSVQNCADLYRFVQICADLNRSAQIYTVLYSSYSQIYSPYMVIDGQWGGDTQEIETSVQKKTVLAITHLSCRRLF